MIVWNGISSKDVGVVVEHYPGIILPKRKVEVIQVPGRNGDIVIEQEAFENYEQSYQVFLDEKNYGGLEAAMPKIANWLMGSYGYRRLEDSYFPEFYRMAYVANGAQFSSWFNIYGEGTLTFNCAPQKFYKSGEREIELKNGGSLSNPSCFLASPTITFWPKSSSTSDIVFTINCDGKESTVTIYIDRQDQTHVGFQCEYMILDVKNHAFTGYRWLYNISGNVGDLAPGAKSRGEGLIVKKNGTAALIAYDESGLLSGEYESFMLGQNTSISWTGDIYTQYTTKDETTEGILIAPNWWTI